ncbi:Rad21 / Rec8 like protein [Ostertagia ostertagi]
MTYQQALTESVFEPPDRGPSSKLWHYRSSDSSTESSVSDILPGIAYLRETPPRFLDKDGKEGRGSEERDYTLTPSKITLKETPDRYKSSFPNEQLDDLSLKAVAQEQLQMAVDISLQEEPRVRESHGSYVEQARRMTSGTSEFDRRPSSVQLLEPFHPRDVLEQSLQSSSGRFSLPDSLKEKFQQEECLRLIEALSNTSGYVPLSSVIPSASTSRKRAAGLFSSLLRLLAHSVVTVEQDEAYSEIWVRACAASRSSDEDAQRKTA